MPIVDNIHWPSSDPVRTLCLALHFPKGHWEVVTLLKLLGDSGSGAAPPLLLKELNKWTLIYPQLEGSATAGYVLSVSGGLCCFDTLSYVFLCEVFLHRPFFFKKRITANSEVDLRQLCLKLTIGFIFVFSREIIFLTLGRNAIICQQHTSEEQGYT